MVRKTKGGKYGNRSTGGIVAWLALVLAIIALVVAWIAYNRTGQSLETKIRNQVNDSIDSAQQGVEGVQERIQ